MSRSSSQPRDIHTGQARKHTFYVSLPLGLLSMLHNSTDLVYFLSAAETGVKATGVYLRRIKAITRLRLFH